MPRAKQQALDLARTPFTGRAERKVRLLLENRIQPPSGTGIVVAVSGGPDSSALAVILARLAGRLGFELQIAHFDHMLRSRRDARDDAKYVCRLADALGVRMVCGQGDVADEAKRLKTSREDAARRLRYAFLGRVAEETGGTAVALGHTLDDRAETVLMHILRGTGLAGLVGMEPVGRWPFGDGPALYRPLLDLRREETARYCQEAGLEPRLDATNELPVATRNVVRSQLMPALREFNPRISEALARLGEAAATDASFLQQQADRAYDDLARKSGGAVTLPRAALRELHPAVRSRVIARAALAAGVDGTLQALHIAQVAALIEGNRGTAPLPGDVVAELRGDVLRIHPAGGARRIG